MLKLVALILLLIPSSALAQSDNILHGVIASYGVAAFVDVATTEYGLGKGIVHEANPIQKWATDRGPVVVGLAKGSMHVGIGYFLLKYHEKNRKLALASAIGLLAAQVVVDYSNAKVINKGNCKCGN